VAVDELADVSGVNASLIFTAALEDGGNMYLLNVDNAHNNTIQQ
jgi:hypothetical protein